MSGKVPTGSAGQTHTRAGTGCCQLHTGVLVVPPGGMRTVHVCWREKGRHIFHRYFPYSTFFRMVSRTKLGNFFATTMLIVLKKCTMYKVSGTLFFKTQQTNLKIAYVKQQKEVKRLGIILFPNRCFNTFFGSRDSSEQNMRPDVRKIFPNKGAK